MFHCCRLNSVLTAVQRGIDVLIEIDTPGHTAVIGEAHPDFVACYHARPWADYAAGAQCHQPFLSQILNRAVFAEPPAGQLRLANATGANWPAGLFAEVAKMFPSSMISTGGDEVQTTCYDDDEETQRDLDATGLTLNEALTDFVHGTHGALIDAGKTPVVWQGMPWTENVCGVPC